MKAFSTYSPIAYGSNMEHLNYHKLVNLKKRMSKYDCGYSQKIMAVIEECITEAKAVSKKKDGERRSDYQFEDVTCETCGKDYPRGYIYKHRRDVHGHVSKRAKTQPSFDVVLLEQLKAVSAARRVEMSAEMEEAEWNKFLLKNM